MPDFSANTQSNPLLLVGHRGLFIQQTRELAELIGFETRNKYAIVDERGQAVGFAAERQKGFWGFILRQLFGHWRSFDIQIFTPDRRPVYRVNHPFRFLFQRLEVFDATGRKLGAIQQRFAIFTKRFDIESEAGLVIMTVASPIWKIWTFRFEKASRPVATVAKKWSGIFSELLTDKDKFGVVFEDETLPEDERVLLLAATLFIDLQYFEKKAS